MITEKPHIRFESSLEYYVCRDGEWLHNGYGETPELAYKDYLEMVRLYSEFRGESTQEQESWWGELKQGWIKWYSNLNI